MRAAYDLNAVLAAHHAARAPWRRQLATALAWMPAVAGAMAVGLVLAAYSG